MPQSDKRYVCKEGVVVDAEITERLGVEGAWISSNGSIRAKWLKGCSAYCRIRPRLSARNTPHLRRFHRDLESQRYSPQRKKRNN